MIAAPFLSGPYTVRPEWIDYNGHLNLAYYLLIFDQATDALWDVARDRRHGEGGRALHLRRRKPHPLQIRTAGRTRSSTVQSLILGADSKRLHVAHEMRRAADGSVSALQELMFSERRPRDPPGHAVPGGRGARVMRAAEAHAAYPRPDWVGRRVAMPSPA